MSTDHPPAPWRLCGRGWLTVSTAPRPAISPFVPGVVPLSLFGRALVVSAFVDYDASGLLAYRELMVAVVVRKGFRVGLSITDIWVDDETSRRGARAMWGIPKEMAEFTLEAEPRLTAAAAAGDVTLATAEELPRRSPSLPVRLTTSVWQSLNGTAVRTALHTAARVRLTRLRWRTPPSSPLARLTTRPLLHLAVTALRMRFGE
ncbi:acetoacetate decarboxylase family protein [Lentzea sp. NPDC059081]|uniref:acetoacetate decarboxylase family protein n=1 Tax=Lentzea sp. NPDC059081 TaxID=3346719 RepID=UPI00369F570F